MCLYRAVDSEGNTLEFLLSTIRDAEAAKRFFVKALHSTACSVPQARLSEEQWSSQLLRLITVDKNAAYPKAIAALKAAGTFPE